MRMLVDVIVSTKSNDGIVLKIDVETIICEG